MNAYAVRVLVADGDHSLADDYRLMLAPQAKQGEESGLAVWAPELFGAARAHKRFPAIELVFAGDGDAALGKLRAALAEDRPFAITLVAIGSGDDGVRLATELRALDPHLQIILVGPGSELHPVELSERVPPADQLFFLRKPFHSIEIQQMILALTARWRAERRRTGGSPSLDLAELLDCFPGGAAIFDRRDRLICANDGLRGMFPDLADLLLAGTPYEEFCRELAERHLPASRLIRPETWIRERLDWHARAGGAIEQKLDGGRWVLQLEGQAGAGETYCWFYDISEFKQRDLGRAAASHMTQMAQSFAALCDQFRNLGMSAEAAEPQAGNRRISGDVSVLPNAAGGRSGLGRVQALTEKLQAVAQRQRLAPETLQVDKTLGEVVRRQRAEMPPGISIEVITGAGLWPTLLDAGRLAEAVGELLRNAFEAMLNGGRLVVECANVRLGRDFTVARPGMSPGDYIRISIQDSGPGMSSDLAERALNPFFTSRDRATHLGLGLSIVYGFTQQSGGCMEIEGGEGRGTTVTLYFPRAEEMERVPDDDQQQERGGGSARRRAS